MSRERSSPTGRTLIAQPQGNGIAERFIKTLQQQAVYGRIFRNVEEVHQAIERFVHPYNHHWRIERLGYLTPAEARHPHLTARPLDAKLCP